eukprot:COSAG02_NODE_66404_length_255_cov_0.987179_2_plen_59_part_01
MPTTYRTFLACFAGQQTVYSLLQNPIYQLQLLRSRRHRLLFVLPEVQGLLRTLLPNRPC